MSVDALHPHKKKKKFSPRRCLRDYCQKWLFTSQLVTSATLCGRGRRAPRPVPTSLTLPFCCGFSLLRQSLSLKDGAIWIFRSWRQYTLSLRETLPKCLTLIRQGRMGRVHQLHGIQQSDTVPFPNPYSLHFLPDILDNCPCFLHPSAPPKL